MCAPASSIVDAAVLDGYRQAYQDWVNERAATLVEDVERFADAILAGDLDTARSLYAPTRVAWEEIEPIAELFADIDVAVDAREEDFAGGVDDPDVPGLPPHRAHPLGRGRVGRPGDAGRGARRERRRTCVAGSAELVIEPRIMARGAGELIDEVAQSKLTGEEDRYSGTDLWSVDANLAGAERIVDILRPTLETLDRERLDRIDAAFATVRDIMTRYAEGEGFAPFSTISPEDLTAAAGRDGGALGAAGPAARGPRPVRVSGSPAPRRLSRRSFLGAAAGAGATVAVGAVAGPLAGVVRSATDTAIASAQGRPVLVPFTGRHQAGIDRPAISQAATVMAAFDVVAADRDGLRDLFRELTVRARALAEARVPGESDERFPPAESGILGSAIGPADLTTTLSVGASLFDERYGLSARRPRLLTTMPAFPNDQLAPDATHGDLAIQVCAVDAAACIHALRYLMLGTRSAHGPALDGGGLPATQQPGGRGSHLDPEPARLQGRHRQPRAGQRGARAAGLGRARRRRARLGGRRQLPGGAHHPHVRGALGPHRAGRAGADHRPRQAHRGAPRPGPRGGHP